MITLSVTAVCSAFCFLIASWSLSKLISIFTGALAAAVLLILYHSIPACQRYEMHNLEKFAKEICLFHYVIIFLVWTIRKVILWKNSVPSPGKSKLLSEIKVRPIALHLTGYIWGEMCFIFTSCVLMQSAPFPTIMESEETSMCKVQHLDGLSTW